MNIYAIRDTKAETYLSIITLNTDAEAVRYLNAVVNNDDPHNLIRKFPADYELWRLATYDNKTGQIDSTKEFIINCTSLVALNATAIGISKNPHNPVTFDDRQLSIVKD